MSGYSPILELGDDPLTPREKVRQIIDGALNSAIPEPWEVANHATDAILTALASGSGDHAELARDLRAFEGSDDLGNGDFTVCEFAADALEALLAENAALRAENDVLEVERIGLRSAIFGSHDYDPGLRHVSFIEMARATEDARRGADARATEAERKLAEAVGLLRETLAPGSFEGESEINARIRTFLSKEAERG